MFQPALTGCPPNRLTGAAVNEGLGIFVGQVPRPFVEPLLGEFSAFGVRVLQRSAKLGPATSLQLMAHRFRNELAAVLLAADVAARGCR